MSLCRIIDSYNNNNKSFILDNSPYGYKTNIYKQVKNNKNKCQSIEHVTSNNMYIQLHGLHWTILYRDYNSTMFGLVKKYTSKAIV